MPAERGIGDGQQPQQLASVHPLAGRDGGVNGLIRGPQCAVLHADDAAAGNPAGERDNAVSGGDDRLPRPGREVDPAMSGEPPHRRRQEAPQHGGLTDHRADRPRPSGRRATGSRTRRFVGTGGGGRDHQRQRGQHREQDSHGATLDVADELDQVAATGCG